MNQTQAHSFGQNLSHVIGRFLIKWTIEKTNAVLGLSWMIFDHGIEPVRPSRVKLKEIQIAFANAYHRKI